MVMCNRISRICNDKRNIRSPSVWFRKNHSTSHTLIHFLNRISSATDQHETTAGIFLDLSKAFDIVHHEILFTKLEQYVFRDAALQCIKSYFSYHYQFVQFNQTCSPKQTIKCSVPQDSILGSSFFILYINDPPNASELIDLLLFADYISIFILTPTQIPQNLY